MPSYKHALPILCPSYTSNTDTTDYTFPVANSHSIHSFLPLLYYLCTSTQRYPHSEPSECPSSRISPGHAIIPIVSTSLPSHPSPALPHRARRPHHFLSSYISNITALRLSAGNARAQPNSTFDIIMAFRIRHYKMSPGGIRCRMPPGRLKVAVTYSPTFAVPSA